MTARLSAGAAQVDITPRGNIHLAGDVGKFRPAIYVADPLCARALVLDDGRTRLCILSLDLTMVTDVFTERIREEAAGLGLASDSVMVHAVQNHSAPALGHFMFDRDFATPPDLEWLRGGDPRYFDFAVERIVEATRAAVANVEPVEMGIGRGVEGRLAFNRRAVMKDGRVYMPGPRWQEPLGPTNIRYMEGPVDPEVGVAAFRTPDLRMKALLLHHTCHPVNVFPRRVVSADWPGAWARGMQRVFGPDCVPLVLNGCCGNINPWDPFDPGFRPDHERMGARLAETTLKVIEAADYRGEAELGASVRRLRLPIREVEPELLARSTDLVAEHPQPVWSSAEPDRVEWDWMKAASIVSVDMHRRRDATLEYEVQALRVGDLAVVGLPGEPFVEGQLRVKMASPAAQTIVAHCTSHYVGYVPTREAFARGGHECESCYWSKLTPDALDTIVEAATELAAAA